MPASTRAQRSGRGAFSRSGMGSTAKSSSRRFSARTTTQAEFKRKEKQRIAIRRMQQPSPFAAKTFDLGPAMADIVTGFAGGTLRSEADRGRGLAKQFDLQSLIRQDKQIRQLEKKRDRGNGRRELKPSPTLLLGPKGQVGRAITGAETSAIATSKLSENKQKLLKLRRKVRARSRLRGLR